MPGGQYHSPRRAQAAAATRAAILQAARELFVREGYAATTVAGIAARADVAVPTVYAAVGGKAELLQALTDAARTSPEVAETIAAIRAADDPAALLGALAGGSRALLEEHADIMRVAAATPEVPEAHAAWRLGLDETAAIMAAAVDRLAALSALRPGLPRSEAIIALTVLVHPSTYDTLISQLGLSWDEAQTWMRATAQRLLLE